ncbi:hypothetical protein [Zhaonella formicivorans]|uniref:hypothetical protein n=1 Tax=Zhaonella formicivorans TaxID=2528593 RepID=UPI0010E6AEC7|nr:hypothetical protein [Zhaonella formicivorans]
MANNRIVAFVDKTIVKITGIEVKGLKPQDVEAALTQFLGSPVRLIGVTGDSLQMDVYGIDPERILRDETGIIKTISAVPGLTAADVAAIVRNEKAREVSLEDLQHGSGLSCPKERWLARDAKESSNNSHR